MRKSKLFIARMGLLACLLPSHFLAGQETPKPTLAGAPLPSNMLYRQTPKYPASARAAHIEGTVLLHAIIAADGSVESLEPISGPPMLFNAAIDAVKHWIYKPYVVQGKAMRVDTTVSVNFNLAKN